MIEKYGKPVNMRALRDFDSEIESNKQGQEYSKKYYDKDAADVDCCRVCKSKDISLYFTGYNGYSRYQCNNCKCVFLANLPRVEEMYGESDTLNEAFYISDEAFKKRVDIIVAPKVDFVLEVSKEAGLKPESWVDIGSGGGQLLWYVKSLGMTEWGVESDKAEYDFCVGKDLNVINSFVDPKKVDPAVEDVISKADVVSMITVLEHIEDPKALIDYLASKMKKDALLVIEVPRHPSVSSYVCSIFTDVVYRHMDLPGHLQIFNEKTMELLFGENFTPVGKWCFGQGFSDLINLPLVSNESAPIDQDLYSKIMAMNNDIQKIMDSNDLGDELLIIAKKN